MLVCVGEMSSLYFLTLIEAPEAEPPDQEIVTFQVPFASFGTDRSPPTSSSSLSSVRMCVWLFMARVERRPQGGNP